MRFLIIGLMAFLVMSCNTSGSDQTNDGREKMPKIFEKVAAKKSGIDFFNKVENTEEMNLFSYRNFYNGGGVAIGDINNDGLSDIYFTSNLGENKLYLNKGDFQFEDISEKAGIRGTKGWSTGVVMVDINNDGLLDIYVCNAGFKKGAYDYKTKEQQENELFINNGDLTFTDKAREYNLDQNGYTSHAAFFDYDRDGDLDAYILNNSFVQPSQILYEQKRDLYDEDWELRDFLKGGGDKLLRNDGGVFTDVSRDAGIYGSLIGMGLGITVGDINNDGWLDMYVSNDFFERDYLYINQKNGTFKDEITDRMGHQSLSSMGADMADINNDGYSEVFVTEMLPDDEYKLKTNTNFDTYTNYLTKVRRGFNHQFMHNTLQLNNQDETFSEIAYYSGVAASDWSWGALMFDVDNDGYRDIYVCNGIYQDVIDQDFINFFANEEKQRMVMRGSKTEMQQIIDQMPSNPIANKLFRNNHNLKFYDVAKEAGVEELSFSNGAAYGDLDNDGDLDLVVNNVNQESFVFKNNTNEVLSHHSISIQLKGSETNTFAVGSKVKIHTRNEVMSGEMIPSRGFQSSVDYKLVFGIGEEILVNKVEVFWFDGTYSVIKNPKVDALSTIDYSKIKRTKAPKLGVAKKETIFTEVNNDLFEAHKEDDFVDFFHEGLTIRMVSKEGPSMSVGDVNGDGKEDVFIGGAVGQTGQLYIQNETGFEPKAIAAFKNTAGFEDVTSAFFDVDGDGDLDLYVGSGGNHVEVNNRFLLDRLYINDGTGDFNLSISALPPSGFNTGIVLPFDYDKDGDLDLFVGNRSMPGNYGFSPRSYILENYDGGVFRNVTKEVAPDFEVLGLVTDAQLVDVTGDQQEELIVVGEWMYPKVFQLEGKTFKELKTGLEKYSGWWYTVQSDDVDGDGDQDLILGNRGENFFFTGTAKKPAKLWLKDFDDNKMYEKIITRTIDGKDMTVTLKDELTEQIVSLKKQNLKHREFAKKSIQELFPDNINKAVIQKEANYFKSVIALNDGNGQYSIQDLPKEVQFSCVCDIYCSDLNGDGKNDLILGGNYSGFLPQFSKLDASYGHVLMNNGDGSYQRVPNHQTGIQIKGDIKKISQITINGEKHIISALNNDRPKIYKLQ